MSEDTGARVVGGVGCSSVRANVLNNRPCPFSGSTADLGPPVKVELRPAGNLLDVTISEPRSSQDTVMKEHLSKLYYRIKYWEQSQDGKVKKPLTCS